MRVLTSALAWILSGVYAVCVFAGALLLLAVFLPMLLVLERVERLIMWLSPVPAWKSLE